MSSPYAPPEAEDPVVTPRAAGKGIRLTARSLGCGTVLAACALAHFAGKLEATAQELGTFDGHSFRVLAFLLLRYGGSLPFFSVGILAATGIILSFRSRSRYLPMLAFAIASLLLTAASFFGTILLMFEIVRIAGGP